MAGQKYRHEYKHCIDRGDYIALKARLKTVLAKDSHSGPSGGYVVHSLYFDTPDDKALREKLNGISRREKIRLRHYDDDFSYIRLEKKAKVNGYGRKEAATVSREEAQSLLQGEYGWLKEREEPLLSELYAKFFYQQLKPKVLVEYVREPFVYHPGNVRITLDSEIRSGLYGTDFFQTELPTLSSNPRDMIVLEVKYDEFLPDFIRDVLQLNQRQPAAFSKYVNSRQFYFY